MDSMNTPETKKAIQQLVKKRSYLPAVIVVALIFISYVAGMYLLFANAGDIISVLSIPLLALSMILAFYLTHDCAHFLALRSRKGNILLGKSLSLINGLAYTPFRDYQKDHLRHHANKIDIIGMDISALQKSLPRLFTKLALMLEFLYIPAFF